MLDHLTVHGLRVPYAVPAADGRRHIGGVTVHPFFPGAPPRCGADWRRVVAVLREVHRLTPGWPQRPGFASANDLMTATTGGDVDLAALPSEAVTRVRAAWRPLPPGPRCVVHGDFGGGNVLVDGTTVAIVDWDEAGGRTVAGGSAPGGTSDRAARRTPCREHYHGTCLNVPARG